MSVEPGAEAAEPLVDALVKRFARIGDERMRDLPLYNAALKVEAIGFRGFGEDWLGVLITPWFMNVMLLPKESEAMDMARMGKSVRIDLPAGPANFLHSGDEEYGAFKSLSLYSPMFDFANQDTARAAARGALLKLMRSPAKEAEPATAPAEKKAPSRRDLLRGRARSEDRS